MHPFPHSMPCPKRIARYYAKHAVRALYDEVSLYPKPGLVSFVDSGAHHDMDGQLFFRSLLGLRHYFYQVGLQAALDAPLHQLVLLGQKAEETMSRITSGVNTHRGAIFSLGIFCTSICKLSMKQQHFSLEQLHQAIIVDWADYLRNEHHNQDSHGAIVKQKYAALDAKQMAIEGYFLVFDTYQALLSHQHDKLFFGLLAYQNLLLTMDDTNILYRAGSEGLTFARDHIQNAVISDDRALSIEQAIKVHRIFSEKNISPGGVADMLSVMYFLRNIPKVFQNAMFGSTSK